MTLIIISYMRKIIYMRPRFAFHNLWYCTDDTLLQVYNTLVVAVLQVYDRGICMQCDVKIT